MRLRPAASLPRPAACAAHRLWDRKQRRQHVELRPLLKIVEIDGDSLVLLLARARGEIFRAARFGLFLARGKVLRPTRRRLLLSWRGVSLARRSIWLSFGSGLRSGWKTEECSRDS
jgi:hypothetical protein